jgi:hypothetical protein
MATTIFGLAILVYSGSYIWPVYEWDAQVASPTKEYDMVVLRRDAAAFADYYYSIYAFPHDSTPSGFLKGKRVYLTPIWRRTKYLVYAGYSRPLFCWTSAKTVSLTINEATFSEVTLYPVKNIPDSDDSILVSFTFNLNDDKCSKP